MSTGIFSIGISGIRAAQLGLLTTEHNIANASTEGYSRQRIIQTTNIPVATGSGFVGQGTSVSAIERLYSQTLVNQVNTAQSSVSELDAYYAQIKQIDNMLADQSAGLSPALQDYFRGIQDVAANPASLAARQSMVSSAEALVSRFQSMEARLVELREGVGTEITATVASINSYARQIGELNQRIVLAQATTLAPANDLLDQRDHLMSQLNELVEVRSTVNSDGTYNVFFGTGQQLVVGTQVTELVAQAAYADISRIVVGIKTAGAVQELPENLITGGALAGLLNFRSETLDRATNDLGRIAATLAQTMNAQHALGQNLLGQAVGEGSFVGDLFSFSGPKVVANSRNASGSATVSADFTSPPPFNGSNFYTDLTGSDYQLTYNAGTLTLTRLSDNKTWSGGSIAAINTALATDPQGFTLSDDGAGYSTGDSYLIQPTRDVARNILVNTSIAADPRLIAAALPIRTTTDAGNTGSAQISAGTITPDPTLAPNLYSLASLPISIDYNGGNLANFPNGPVTVTVNGVTTSYTITAPTDTVPYTSGATVTLAGLSFTISGTPNNGDSFNILRNSAGVSDSRNALALGQLQTQGTVAGGTANYQVAYSRLVSDAGNKTREIQVTAEAQSALLKQAQNSRDALSGVNLDEEAANLLRFQQAYQASAKVIDIGSRLFDVILSIRA